MSLQYLAISPTGIQHANLQNQYCSFSEKNILENPIFLDPEPFKCEGSITLTLFVSCVVCRVWCVVFGVSCLVCRVSCVVFGVSCPEKFLVVGVASGK